MRVFETYADFKEMHVRAVDFLSKRPWKFWEEENLTGIPQNTLGQNLNTDNKREAINFIMRPIIKKGEITAIHSWRGLEKSSLSYC